MICKEMRHIVLDTNCLIQIISTHTPYRKIWNAFLQRKFILCISNEILNEYQEILQIQTTASIAENIVSLLLNCSNVKFVNPTFRFNLIKQDQDDNKFVDCAIVSGADFIVTEDSHFNVLKNIKFPSVSILTMDEFLLLIE
jgi:putative PIN family toxin of toxin-antitoxin system